MKSLFPSPRLHFQRGYWFHNFIVALDQLDYLPGPVALLGCLALPGLAGLAWPGHFLFAAGLPAAALLVEAASLLASRLPASARERSPSPFAGPMLLFALGHAAATLVAATFLSPSLGASDFSREALLLHCLLQTGLLAAFLYGYWVEPWRVGVRRETIELRNPANKFAATSGGTTDSPSPPSLLSTHYSLLVLSDLHLDRRGPREDQVLAHARAARPDLILIPGDLTNLSTVNDPTCADHAIAFLKELRALAPVFVSLGTPEVDDRDWIRSLTSAAGVVLLDNSVADFPDPASGGAPAFTLVGVTAAGPIGPHRETLRRLLADRASTPSARLPVILLYHTPDLIETAAACGVRLQVSGHTHGGQVRLPVIGPLITASRYGRRFASGRFEVGADGAGSVGKTTLIVSRGVGLEGAGAPRLRFFCPPEVVQLTVNLR